MSLPHRFLSGLCVGLLLWPVLASADEPAAEARAKLMAQMRSLAKATTVTLKNGQTAELVAEPVFRYADQQRRFVDASLWCWTSAGRPVAFQKIEALLHVNTNEPRWQYCWTSMADQPVTVQWENGRVFATTVPGLVLKPLPTDAPPAQTAPQRIRQLRALARDFASRNLINPRTNETAEMRLLPTPFFEYNEEGSQRPRGAVFGFTSHGTNPDLLVMIEAVTVNNTPTWMFSPARMTTGGLKLRFRDELVWEAEFVQPSAGPFPEWTFFQTPRLMEE